MRLETITFSDATLSDINVVLCYVLSQYRFFVSSACIMHETGSQEAVPLCAEIESRDCFSVLCSIYFILFSQCLWVYCTYVQLNLHNRILCYLLSVLCLYFKLVRTQCRNTCEDLNNLEGHVLQKKKYEKNMWIDKVYVYISGWQWISESDICKLF